MNLKSMTILLLGLGILSAPAFAADTPQSGVMPQPGALNYVEGSASLEGQKLSTKSVGDTQLNPGEVLTTDTGKVELLLTPGVFLRLDDHSAVKMISPGLTLTQVELLHGRAGVEVDEIHPENDLEIIDAGVVTQLVKNGYYEFDANNPTAMVFNGKAAVEIRPGKYRVVKDHHEFQLAPGPGAKPLAKEKTVSFNVKKAKDDLYNWSSLRSEYLAEDNQQVAGQYADDQNFDPGWYWDPYAMDYTFIGGGPFWSPFGFGFYPPYGGGLYGGYYGGYGGGYYGGGYGGMHNYGTSFGSQGGLGVRPRGGPIHMGGLRNGGGFGGFHGGSFHGGGMGGGLRAGGGGGFGGFHGGGGGFGGGGGGFHGGGGGGGGHR